MECVQFGLGKVRFSERYCTVLLVFLVYSGLGFLLK